MALLCVGGIFLLFLVIWPSVAGVNHTDLVNDNELDEETYLDHEDFKEFKEENLQEILGIRAVERSAKSVDPTLRAKKFEGDIVGLSGLSIQQYAKDNSRLGRNAIRDRHQLWPNGVIPYRISKKYGSYARKMIAKAIRNYHKSTCIHFKNRTDESDYIYIRPDDGCYSSIGRQGGKQIISLDAGCIQIGTIMHELMHSTGFFHEQSRTDRDEYIKILWDNIQPDMKDQFQKYSLRQLQYLGESYDYGSVMHYGPNSFSANGKETIVKRSSRGPAIGQRKGFSATDIRKLNKLYGCEQQITTVTPTNVATCSDKAEKCKLPKRDKDCRSFWFRSLCPFTCDLCPK